MAMIYEMMGFYRNFNVPYELRNGSDVLLRQIFSTFGNNAQLFYGITMLLILIVIMIKNRDVLKKGQLKYSFLFLMVLESIFWCGSFLLIMSLVETLPLSIAMGAFIFDEFYLSIGAGIWEELIFRAGAISLFTIILNVLLGYSHIFSIITSILTAALIFSLFHYIGTFGDTFTYKSFISRSLAGIFLGILYYSRGLGISVYTHIFYDMMIISLPVIHV